LTEPGIVTPEAVVLAFETAGVGSRLIAKLIDLAVQGVALGLVIAGAVILGTTSIGLAGVYFGVFLIVFGYPLAMETLWRGRTLGKAAMGLRVVTVEGAPIRFRHALVRDALGLVDFFVTSGGAAILSVLLTTRNQRLGDLAAGTLVLRERRAAQTVSAVSFWVPPGWEGYAATLDVTGVTGADYQVVRSFLVRAQTLDVWTRDRLAREIATAILPRLRHQPPPGVPAEVLLVCVAALYQQRQRSVARPVAAPPGWNVPVGSGGPAPIAASAPAPAPAPAPVAAPVAPPVAPPVVPPGPPTPIPSGDGFRPPD
jgi:uncharacterized RDD family membrane protein YckC